MILNQQLFNIKVIDQNNGDMLMYIPPQQIIALKMEKTINDISSLVITLPFSESVWNVFGIDRLIEISTTNYTNGLLEKEETFFMRKREVYYEGAVQQIAFGCVGLTHLLDRRVTKPTTDDNNNGGGFVTKAGVAGTVLQEFANEQMISPEDVNRTFPNLTFNKVSDGNIVGIRGRYQVLREVFDDVRVNGGVDYQLERDNDNDLVLKVGVLGTDKTYSTNFPNDYLLFSPNLGNVDNPLFEMDSKDQKNFIFTLGEGEGSNQKVLGLSGLGIGDSVYNRIEKAIETRKGEGSLGSANQQSLTQGLKELNSQKPKTDFRFGIRDNILGFQYRLDFDIGDLCTFYWEGQQINFQIKSTTFTVSNDKVNREIKLELIDG